VLNIEGVGSTLPRSGALGRDRTDRETSAYPRLRNGCITIEYDKNTVLSSWWFKLPVYNPEEERGNSIWVPERVPEKDTHLLEDEYIGDSELVHRDGE
jgi:putative transposase